MLKFVFIPIFFGFCHGFLLNSTVVSSGGKPSGGAQKPMTDNHYLLLTDLLGLERQSREKLKQSLAQMESFVLQLQKQLTSTMQEVASLKANNNAAQTQSVLEVKHETTVLKDTIIKMKDDHTNLKNTVDDLQRNLVQVQTDNNALKRDNMKLKSQVEILSNSSQNIKNELGSFVGSATASEIRNITTLTNNIQSLNVKMSSMNAKLSVLSSNSFSRSQDFLALINQSTLANQKITQLTNQTTLANQKITQLTNQTTLANQKITHLTNQAKDLENKTMQQSMEVTDLISKENSLQSSVNKLGNVTKNLLTNQTGAAAGLTLLKQRITNLETHQGAEVILTSCASSTVTYNSNQVIKFPATKTVYGITKLDDFHNTGKFTCEKPGTYFFSVSIMSPSSGSIYGLYKGNGEWISWVYVSGNSEYHTGASTVAVQLDKGDYLYAKTYSTMQVYAEYSCFTVIQIR